MLGVLSYIACVRVLPASSALLPVCTISIVLYNCAVGGGGGVGGGGHPLLFNTYEIS